MGCLGFVFRLQEGEKENEKNDLIPAPSLEGEERCVGLRHKVQYLNQMKIKEINEKCSI